MSGHTPGPWHWSDEFKTGDDRKTWSLISDADGYGILTCDGEENAPQGINDHANARLIAAAPDLLAICQRILDHPLIRITGDVEIPLRSAISKATGEQP